MTDEQQEPPCVVLTFRAGSQRPVIDWPNDHSQLAEALGDLSPQWQRVVSAIAGARRADAMLAGVQGRLRPRRPSE